MKFSHSISADFGLAKLRDSDCSKMTSVVGTMYYACPEIIQHLPYNEKAGLSCSSIDGPSQLNRLFALFFLKDIWSLGCVLYHMATLVPPFYTSNLLSLASKICNSEYDRTPLASYSDRVLQIIVECLCIEPQSRPDICSVAKICTEQLMIYTDRSCGTIQTLEKRLRQQDHQRELDLIKQQSQLQHQQSLTHQRCLSCSSTKESLVSNSGGIGDVSFDGADGQHEIMKADAFTASMTLLFLSLRIIFSIETFVFFSVKFHLILNHSNQQSKIKRMVAHHNPPAVPPNQAIAFVGH